MREHYRILEDTLVGEQLPPYRRTRTRKAVATARFYFFDVGVANTLRRTGVIEPGSDAYGRALEHLVFLELRAWLDYQRRDDPLTYWRSRSQLEVDFVVGDAVAVEVKAKSRVAARDYRGLRALAEEIPLRRKLVVCNEPRRRRDDDGVEIVPVGSFLDDPVGRFGHRVTAPRPRLRVRSVAAGKSRPRPDVGRRGRRVRPAVLRLVRRAALNSVCSTLIIQCSDRADGTTCAG